MGRKHSRRRVVEMSDKLRVPVPGRPVKFGLTLESPNWSESIRVWFDKPIPRAMAERVIAVARVLDIETLTRVLVEVGEATGQVFGLAKSTLACGNEAVSGGGRWPWHRR